MEIPDKRKAIRDCRRWLETFTWTWYVRLKIRTRTVSNDEMKTFFKEWISRVKREYGGSDFRWVSVLEDRSTMDKRHFHVLIGGLRNRRQDAATAWSEIEGDAILDRYDADKGGVLSMLKTMDDKGRLDIDFSLPKTPGVWPPASIADRSHRRELDPKDKITRLRVANIGDDISPNDLRRLFSRYVTVTEVWIRSTPNYRFALLDIAGDNVASAVENLNGIDWRGQELRVQRTSTRDTWSDFESTLDFDV